MRQAQLSVGLEPAAAPVLDREHCPAVAIELAPLRSGDGATRTPDSEDYRQKAVAAVAAAMQQWRKQRMALEAGAADYVKKGIH